MNVLFLHTYVGLGKSTFFRLLQKKYPESYEIVSSDKINKEMREAKLRFKSKDVRKKFEQKIKLSKKIVLADKNFPTLKDSKNLTKNTERISTILYAKDSFELPSILLLLNRVLKRTDHETISPDDDIETMRIMLNFVQKSKASSRGKPQKVSHIDIKVNFFKNNISTANISIFKKAEAHCPTCGHPEPDGGEPMYECFYVGMPCDLQQDLHSLGSFQTFEQYISNKCSNPKNVITFPDV